MSFATYRQVCGGQGTCGLLKSISAAGTQWYACSATARSYPGHLRVLPYPDKLLSLCCRCVARKQLQELAYGDGHVVNGVTVPTQGFNVFASVTMSGALVCARCCSPFALALKVSADTGAAQHC